MSNVKLRITNGKESCCWFDDVRFWDIVDVGVNENRVVAAGGDDVNLADVVYGGLGAF
jgi:hypothetical protein